MKTAHIIPNPNGTFSLVGRIPVHPRTARFLRLDDPKARSAIMGQRVVEWRGKRYAWNGRAFPSIESAERALRMTQQAT